jgi:ubiquinone/menaquinone biosynthesis C-methylase UbiE
MSPTEERYVIRGGREGYERLQLLARERWPDTLALFRRAGLAPGMRCLDVGCGGGAVTLELAKLVAPAGAVIGIDMDEVKLDLARRAAAELELDNVEFRRMNVHEWNEPGAYDAVYSRFLLQHLAEPVALIRRMWAGVRPGGVLIVEDADFDGCFSDPPNEAFDYSVSAYFRVARRYGGDPSLGRKLYRCFLEAGIPDPTVDLVQSVRTHGESKKLPWLTLHASAEAIISAGQATAEELDARLADLARFTEDPTTFIGGPRIFQIWVRR